MGVLQMRLRIDHRDECSCTLVLVLIRADHRHGYRRTTRHGYGHTTGTATGVPQAWLRACHRHGYRRIMATATGVLRLGLWANVRAYYINFLLCIPYRIMCNTYSTVGRSIVDMYDLR